VPGSLSQVARGWGWGKRRPAPQLIREAPRWFQLGSDYLRCGRISVGRIVVTKRSRSPPDFPAADRVPASVSGRQRAALVHTLDRRRGHASARLVGPLGCDLRIVRRSGLLRPLSHFHLWRHRPDSSPGTSSRRLFRSRTLSDCALHAPYPNEAADGRFQAHARLRLDLRNLLQHGALSRDPNQRR
jgi:hypothetical protein